MKFTNKQLCGYYKAKREWITANDSYNLGTFGITVTQYSIIRGVEQECFGICQGAEKLSLNRLNKEIA